MPKSVLDAIRLGVWDFEPERVASGEYSATEAIPGSENKLVILSERLRLGLPLWHPSDRRDYSNPEDDDFEEFA